jgi:hypothetical protein
LATGEFLPSLAARAALLKGQDGSIVVHEIWPIGFFGLAAAAVALAASAAVPTDYFHEPRSKSPSAFPALSRFEIGVPD